MSSISMSSIRANRAVRCVPGKLSEFEKDDLEQLVREWIKNARPRSKVESRFNENMKSLNEAIKYAALAKTSENKRHSHQRQNEKALEIWAKQLLAPKVKKHIKSSPDFRRLISVVEAEAEKVNPSISSKFPGTGNRIGELTIYDTAHRIGAYLSIYPKEVYLHCGTKKGAGLLGLRVNRKSIPMKDFSAPIQRLKAHEIEDFLCWYSHIDN